MGNINNLIEMLLDIKSQDSKQAVIEEGEDKKE